MMNKNTKIGITIGIIIIIVVILSFMFARKGSDTDTAVTQVTENEEGLNDNATSTPATGTAVTPGTPTRMTYQQALIKYEDLRIQVSDCTLLPTSVTYKNGTSIMVDNRSAQVAYLTFDKQTVNLNAYQFKVITLRNGTTPHQIKVNCKTGGIDHFNVGQILLQK